MNHKKILRLTQGALVAALAFVVFQFLRFDIPVGTERTAVHLGNAVVVLGALLLGGGWGGAAGAIGLTIADLLSGYVTSAPKTFILKMVMGLIAGLISRRVFNVEKETSAKAQSKIALISSAAALGCNVVLDPLFGYFYKTYLFGIPQDMAAALAKIGSLATLTNAVISTIVVTALWPALYTVLHRAGLLIWDSEKQENSDAESTGGSGQA